MLAYMAPVCFAFVFESLSFIVTEVKMSKAKTTILRK